MTPKLPKVLLLQLPIPPPGPEPVRGNVPLAAGYLKLMTQSCGLDQHFNIEILPADAANQLGDQALVDEIISREPWLLGFTSYLWNIDRSLWVAREVKARRPETLVILGGPEITSDNSWVLESPSYDFAAIGEGEQTFADLLQSLLSASPSFEAIPGLIRQKNGGRLGVPRLPMPDLDRISSPYLAGILNAGDQEQLLLETIRGCVFNCKFCYYPKAYDKLYYVSREKILANLAHARANGAREVYLLDPTLNQRRDFAEFLGWLKEGNPDRSLELYAELRAEGINSTNARLLREANFKEVEIGLQSTDPVTQEIMDRKNNLKAFERGVKALQAEGIRVKVDLIVGLPGDTVDSVHRGMDYLAENNLYDDIQVFQLSILPGTAFRHEAEALGLEFQPRPPYYVLRTPTLSLEDMLGLLAEAEDVFEREFDALPPPSLETSLPVMDLDSTEAPFTLPRSIPQASTLWFRSRDLYRHTPRMERAIRGLLDQNPFTTLQVVLETGGDFPFDVFKRLRAACQRRENNYLDRFYEFTPGRRRGAQRFVTLLPEAARSQVALDWAEDSAAHADLVWK